MLSTRRTRRLVKRLFAINRYFPAMRVRAAKIEPLAAKRQERFALSAVSQILRVDYECLPIQPRSFGGRDVTRVVARDRWRSFAIEPIKPDQHVIRD
jgi:hypothetical protein